MKKGVLIRMGLIRVGAVIGMGGELIGIGALITKNTFKGISYSKLNTRWKECAESNHYSKSVPVTFA